MQELYLPEQLILKEFSQNVPAANRRIKVKSFILDRHENVNVIYKELKPIWFFFRIYGMFPFQKDSSGNIKFKLLSLSMLYSVLCFSMSIMFLYYGNSHISRAIAERGREFHGSIVLYNVLAFLGPQNLQIPFHWIESGKVVRYFKQWAEFQVHFKKVTNLSLSINIQKRVLISAVVTPWIVMTFLALQYVSTINVDKSDLIIPVLYYYILSSTGLHASAVVHTSMCIQKAAQLLRTSLKERYKEHSLMHCITEYKIVWCKLSHITQETTGIYTYSLCTLFLSWFVLTMFSSFGLLIQISEKSINVQGLCYLVNIFFTCAGFIRICEAGHSVSKQVGAVFLEDVSTLILESNESSLPHLKDFLTAITANPPDMSLGGYININRKLEISFLSTVVTYLVVMLQYHAMIHHYNNAVIPIMNTTVFEVS